MKLKYFLSIIIITTIFYCIIPINNSEAKILNQTPHTCYVDLHINGSGRYLAYNCDDCIQYRCKGFYGRVKSTCSNN